MATWNRVPAVRPYQLDQDAGLNVVAPGQMSGRVVAYQTASATRNEQ
ncbi:hypothetical protein [Streptomyces sp. NPDC053560]